LKILITDNVNEVAASILSESKFEIIEKPTLSKEKLLKEIENYDGIILRSATKLNYEILNKAKNLKIIGRVGVGLDNIDLKKSEEMGINVVNSPEPASIAVAEFTIGIMITLMRHISKGDQACHTGIWIKQECLGNLLYGKKLGIIGFGKIGMEVATRAMAFKMRIGVYDVLKDVLKNAEKMAFKVYKSIEELLKNSDIITLHVPYNEGNHHLINRSRLNLLNKNKILINTARGKLIDEVALIEKLKKREIKGAALDVYYEEPLIKSELFELDNVILTPHIASQTIENQIEGAKIIAHKFVEFFKKY